MEKEWVELVPIMLVPCTGCGSLWEPDQHCPICDWQPDQSCPICNDVDLSEVKEEIQDGESWRDCS